jgi:hypothetical protein
MHKPATAWLPVPPLLPRAPHAPPRQLPRVDALQLQLLGRARVGNDRHGFCPITNPNTALKCNSFFVENRFANKARCRIAMQFVFAGQTATGLAGSHPPTHTLTHPLAHTLTHTLTPVDPSIDPPTPYCNIARQGHVPRGPARVRVGGGRPARPALPAPARAPDGGAAARRPVARRLRHRRRRAGQLRVRVPYAACSAVGRVAQPP